MRITFLLICLLVAISCNPSKEDKNINVAVAANMQYAMEELVKVFESKNDFKVEISSSSSGILTTQIRNGAPFDVFVSANMKYPRTLYKEGLAVKAPQVYAYGTLVIWSLDSAIDLSDGLVSLTSSEISTVAIANKETAPYGIAAIEALKTASLYENLKHKIIWGESIGQVNQYVLSKVVDVGITSQSVLYSPNIRNIGVSVALHDSLYVPISQGVVLLNNEKASQAKNAELFYDFLLGDEAARVMTEFGYRIR